MTRFVAGASRFFLPGAEVPNMQILFDHPWFIVINKPADLLTQAVDGIQSVQTSLVALLQQRHPDGPTPFIGVPHRLDRVTTGVMVFARNQRSLRRLCEQFAARSVVKKYHALVETTGSASPLIPSNDTLCWEDWIRKIPDVAAGEVCDEDSEGAKKAVLHRRVLESGLLDSNEEKKRASLLELELETGRMHQIRLQCAFRGYPVVGDRLYGSTTEWQFGEFRQEPIALHARSISFRHPQTGEKLFFEAPYPENWNRWVPDPAN